MKQTSKLVSILAFSSLLFTGCKGDEKSTPNPESNGPAAKGDSPERPTKAATPAPIETIDAEIIAEFEAVVAACEFDLKASRVTCANAEDKKLKGMFLGKDAKSKLASIASVAEALADSDPKMQTIAALTLSTDFGVRRFGKEAVPGSVHKNVSQKLRASIEKLGETQAVQAITATVYASTLSDSNAEIFALLERIESLPVQAQGWRGVMVYGRMNAFEKIKVMASSDDPYKTRPAMDAVANMRSPTKEELKVLCPWAPTILGTESDKASDSFLSIKAGQLLAKCGEKAIDSVLDWGKGQLSKGVFPSDYSSIYKGLCRQDGAASVAQCSRATELMEKVAATDSLEAKARGRALTQMASFANAVGNAKTLELMKKYSGSDVPEIKKAAERAVKTLAKK